MPKTKGITTIKRQFNDIETEVSKINVPLEADNFAYVIERITKLENHFEAVKERFIETVNDEEYKKFESDYQRLSDKIQNIFKTITIGQQREQNMKDNRPMATAVHSLTFELNRLKMNWLTGNGFRLSLTNILVKTHDFN